jgi:hypothetical protein
MSSTATHDDDSTNGRSGRPMLDVCSQIKDSDGSTRVLLDSGPPLHRSDSGDIRVAVIAARASRFGEGDDDGDNDTVQAEHAAVHCLATLQEERVARTASTLLGRSEAVPGEGTSSFDRR